MSQITTPRTPFGSEQSSAEPLSFESASEIIRRENKTLAEKPDVLGYSVTKAETDWLHNFVGRSLASTRFELKPDPSFTLTDEVWNTLTEGIEPDYQRMFGNAVSLEHAMWIRDQAMEMQANREYMGRRYEGVGTVGRLLSIDTLVGGGDPSIAIPSMLTGGGFAWGGKTLLTKLALGGAAAAAQQVPFEVYRMREDPAYHFTDFVNTEMFAFGFGAVGSGIHSWSNRNVAKAVANLKLDAEFEHITGRQADSAGTQIPRNPSGLPTPLEQIDAEVAGSIRLRTPKGRAEAEALDIMSSGFYDNSTMRTALIERLTQNHDIGKGVASRIIDRLRPEIPTPPKTTIFKYPPLSFDEHAQIAAALDRVPAARDAVEQVIAVTHEGQQVPPDVVELIHEQTSLPTDKIESYVADNQLPSQPEPPKLFGERLGIPQHFTFEESNGMGFGHQEFGGQSVPHEVALSIAMEMNATDPNRVYALAKTGDGFAVVDKWVGKGKRPATPDGAAQISVAEPTPVQIKSEEAVVRRNAAGLTDVEVAEKARANIIRNQARSIAAKKVEAINAFNAGRDTATPEAKKATRRSKSKVAEKADENLVEVQSVVSEPVLRPTQAEPVAPAPEPVAAPKATGFRTSQGSQYTIDQNGHTTRLKKSSGKGQGQVHEPMPLVFLSQNAAEHIQSESMGGHRVVLANRNADGTFVQVFPKAGEDIRTLSDPHVLVVTKDGKTLAAAKASHDIEVGKQPFEIVYKGNEKTYHLGNTITEITSPAPEPPKAPATPVHLDEKRTVALKAAETLARAQELLDGGEATDLAEALDMAKMEMAAAERAAGSPSTLADKIRAKADDAIAKAEARIKKRQIPRGKNTGATINPIEEIADIVTIAVAKAIKAGANTAEEIVRIVSEIIGEQAPHLKERAAEIASEAHEALIRTRAGQQEAMGAASRTDPVFRPEHSTATQLGDAVALPPDGRRVYWQQSGRDGAARAVETWLVDNEFDPSVPEDMAIIHAARADPERFMQDASRAFAWQQQQTPATPAQGVQIAATHLDFRAVSDSPNVGHERARLSIVGRAGNSQIPLLRLAARILGEDTLNVASAASTWTRRVIRGTWEPVLRLSDRKYAEWARSKGKNMFDRLSTTTRDAFEAEVGVHMTTPGMQGYETTPAHVELAAAYTKAMSDIADMAARLGHPAFVGMQKLKNYLPRIYIPSEFTKGMDLWGAELYHRGWANAIVKGYAKEGRVVTMDQATRIAKGLVAIQIDRTRYTAFDKLSMLEGNRGDMLVEALTTHGVDADTIRNVIAEVVKDPDGKAPPRTRYRIRMDEAHVEMLGEHEFAVMHHLDRNAGRVVHNYVSGVTGAVAEFKFLQELERRTGKEVKTWNRAKQLIADDAMLLGYLDQFKAHEGQLEVLRKMVVGLPVEGDTAWAHISRTMRSISNILLLGGAGWNQLHEIYRTVGFTGLKPVLKAIPEVATFMYKLSKGMVNEREIAEMQGLVSMTGAGVEAIVHRSYGHLDPELVSQSAHRVTQTTDILTRLSHYAGEISGFHLIDRYTRLLTMHATGQYVIELALSNKVPKAQTLAYMGMDSATWSKVSQHIRANHEVIKTPTGSFKGFGIHKWTQTGSNQLDLESSSRLVTAMQRVTESLIQTNDPGNYAKWMTTSTGKLVSHLRTFPIIAYEKQFLPGVKMATGPGADPLRTISMFTISAIGAGFTTMLRDYVNSIGRKDADKYRKERLTWQNFSRAAISRSGWTSMAPNFYDEGSRWFGYQPQFSGIRSSGQQMDILTGFPANSLFMQALPKATKEAVHQGGKALGLASDSNRSMTQSEARSFARLLPLQNAPGFKSAIDSWVSYHRKGG